MPKLTMTLLEVYYAMREAGIRSSPMRISAGIESGAYPFGRVVSKGPNGKRTLEIYRVDFLNWLKTKMPEETIASITNSCTEIVQSEANTENRPEC